jgi:hypothetical protein
MVIKIRLEGQYLGLGALSKRCMLMPKNKAWREKDFFKTS